MVTLYDEAIATFEQCLAAVDASTNPADVQNAKVLLAEAIQNKCELILKLWEAEGTSERSMESLYDPIVCLLGEYTAEHEAAVFREACELLRAAAFHYKTSNGGSTCTNAPTCASLSPYPSPYPSPSQSSSLLATLRVDALVNLGNTLSLWATVAADPVEIDRLYREAMECYDYALILEDDATTRNNKGDVLIAYAEFLAARCEKGFQGGEAEAVETVEAALRVYEAALMAYDGAVQLSDSQKGDNLPMLLLDYGAGYLSMAEFCFKTRHEDARALGLLDEAEKRLLLSVSFGRGSVGVHTALGEVYLLGGEVRNDVGTLERAGEAFGAALRIQRSDVDGLIGAAETAAEMAKRVGRVEERDQLFRQAGDYYRLAFGSGKFTGKLKEKGECLYNYACCMSATSDGVEEAVRILTTLRTKGLVTGAEIRADRDFPDHVRSRFE